VTPESVATHGGEAEARPGCAAACHSRRSVLAAVGAVGAAAALAGCDSYGAAPPVVNQPIASLAPATASPTGAAGEPAQEPAGSAEEPSGDEPAAQALASVSDIPIGGGVVFAARGVVVTHPKEGTVKAFSATCTHAGCAVSEVSGGTINCNCHGSKFKVSDGSVAAGPANRGLSPVGLKVRGDSIQLS
jgi:Rieske Fe-S protein